MLFACDLSLAVFLTIVANIRTALDLRGGEVPLGELLGWAFGRYWAVLLIDFFVSLGISSGTALAFAPQSGDDFFLGLTLLFLCAPLIFCDVVASVEPQERWYAIIPLAVQRSVRLTYQHGNLARAFAIVAFEAVLLIFGVFLERVLSAAHVPGASFLGNQPINTLLTPFFAALTTVVYFDALAREHEERA